MKGINSQLYNREMARMRKVIACIILLSLLGGANVTALAGNERNLSVTRYTNISSIDMQLTFKGTTAKCICVIEGLSGTTNITATFALQRKEANGTYTTIITWPTVSVSGATLRFSETYTIAYGYAYRFTLTTSVTRNGTTETVSVNVENTPW